MLYYIEIQLTWFMRNHCHGEIFSFLGMSRSRSQNFTILVNPCCTFSFVSSRYTFLATGCRTLICAPFCTASLICDSSQYFPQSTGQLYIAYYTKQLAEGCTRAPPEGIISESDLPILLSIPCSNNDQFLSLFFSLSLLFPTFKLSETAMFIVLFSLFQIFRFLFVSKILFFIDVVVGGNFTGTDHGFLMEDSLIFSTISGLNLSSCVSITVPKVYHLPIAVQIVPLSLS